MTQDNGCFNCGRIEKESYARQEGQAYLCGICVQGVALAQKNKAEREEMDEKSNKKRKIKRIRR